MCYACRRAWVAAARQLRHERRTMHVPRPSIGETKEAPAEGSPMSGKVLAVPGDSSSDDDPSTISANGQTAVQTRTSTVGGIRLGSTVASSDSDSVASNDAGPAGEVPRAHAICCAWNACLTSPLATFPQIPGFVSRRQRIKHTLTNAFYPPVMGKRAGCVQGAKFWSKEVQGWRTKDEDVVWNACVADQPDYLNVRWHGDDARGDRDSDTTCGTDSGIVQDQPPICAAIHGQGTGVEEDMGVPGHR